jgi:hypothetical protein
LRTGSGPDEVDVRAHGQAAKFVFCCNPGSTGARPRSDMVDRVNVVIAGCEDETNDGFDELSSESPI